MVENKLHKVAIIEKEHESLFCPSPTLPSMSDSFIDVKLRNFAAKNINKTDKALNDKRKSRRKQ